MVDPPAPRCTVLAARDADVAVVLARGPSGWARLLRWDTAADTVEHGGWLRGRVSGERIDLAPDGRLLVAFVRAEHRRDGPTAWAAVSRPPWWHALALWGQDSAWSFGGFFPDARSLAGHASAPDLGAVPGWFDARAALPAPLPVRAWTDRTVPHNRRLRDGWALVDGDPAADGPGTSRWRRPLGRDAALELVEHVDGVGRVARRARVHRGGATRDLPPGASADVDRRGRVLVALDGRLEVITRDGPRHVGDVTTAVPDPRPAPAWAREWPRPA